MLAGLGVDPCMKVMYDGREDLLGLLMKVGNSYSGSKDSIIRVLGGKVCGGLSCEIL